MPLNTLEFRVLLIVRPELTSLQPKMLRGIGSQRWQAKPKPIFK